jgi:hypothetical protein
MTPALVFAAAFVVMSVAYLLVACDRDKQRETVEGLRDQLAAEQDVAKHWHDVAEDLFTRLQWSGNVTPSFVGERPTLRASEPRWTDKDGNAVGFNDKVVPLRPEGEGA